MSEEYANLIVDGFTPKWYHCKKGHRFQLQTPLFITMQTNQERFDTKPLCPYCIVEALNEQFAAEQE